SGRVLRAAFARGRAAPVPANAGRRPRPPFDRRRQRCGLRNRRIMRTDGITFIVPNWNHELVLPRAVRSGLRAGEQLRDHNLNVEVLIVDDASRDGSPMLLRQLEALYYDQGVRVLALQQNSGPSTARNLALTRATYRYVIFMDADNEIVPDNVIHFYRSIRATEAAVVYGNILIYDLQGTEFCSHESYQARMFGM